MFCCTEGVLGNYHFHAASVFHLFRYSCCNQLTLRDQNIPDINGKYAGRVFLHYFPIDGRVFLTAISDQYKFQIRIGQQNVIYLIHLMSQVTFEFEGIWVGADVTKQEWSFW